MQRVWTERGVFGFTIGGLDRVLQGGALASQKRADIGRRICVKAAFFKVGENRQSLLEGPTKRHAHKMEADDHGIALAPFAITGGPHPSDEELTRTLPHEQMVEPRQLLGRFKFLPCARIDLTSNAVHIKNELGEIQAFGFESKVLDMVVPAGVFAKSRQSYISARRVEPPWILEQKLFEEIAHRELSNGS